MATVTCESCMFDVIYDGDQLYHTCVILPFCQKSSSSSPPTRPYRLFSASERNPGWKKCIFFRPIRGLIQAGTFDPRFHCGQLSCAAPQVNRISPFDFQYTARLTLS